ncbi:uncharacterized protein LOC115704233 [Cannabis sativa]|uniref:uncharacterized protein LOC115704233 n=1 Tax=Cannabis sativa TaxID=3483 RepID=UPI0029CA85EA|nr:uncharacterized protein LOC115704233 [Cannabis sativa]
MQPMNCWNVFVTSFSSNSHTFGKLSKYHQIWWIVFQCIYFLLSIKCFCSFGSFRDCPNDIHEAISSLIYASPWCGELPELLLIRRLFAKRYGQNFATVALELSPGNHVNLQVKEKLSTLSISEDMKQKLVNEIVKEYCLTPDILALDYYYDWAEQKVP